MKCIRELMKRQFVVSHKWDSCIGGQLGYKHTLCQNNLVSTDIAKLIKVSIYIYIYSMRKFVYKGAVKSFMSRVKLYICGFHE
jgi:hypothetical protein